jgi:uncharacterized membrane protein
MYIGRNKKKKTRGQMFLSIKEFENKRKEVNKPVKVSSNAAKEKYSAKPLLHWRAPEFEIFQRDKKWYVLITGLLILIVIYALYTNSLVMAITFILIGVVGFMYINKEPRILDFMITDDGIVAGREIYTFDSLKSFWIFYEPDGMKEISLCTESYLTPYVHIPVHDQEPAKIRELLLSYIPEEKQEPGLVETIERIIKL